MALLTMDFCQRRIALPFNCPTEMAGLRSMQSSPGGFLGCFDHLNWSGYIWLPDRHRRGV
ncbi:unnamed protein product [Linum tenue]|uniref:Uncharacterized protein n=1 Tax=Linum tenue TaxID=586396 RepID=A0AAV0RTA5_9ROSI|nr:unnamed protein product [Linum tenue]